jgi:hypothetical protein
MFTRRALFPALGVVPFAPLLSGPEKSWNVRDFGARGNGNANDQPAIQAALDAAHTNGGGEVIVPQGLYAVATAILPRSGVTLRGEGPDKTILKAQNGSVDNVVGIDYLVDGQMAARRANKPFNHLSAPNFGRDLSQEEARETGGYAGYGLSDFHLRDLAIDGNKANCPENGNLLSTNNMRGRFDAGQIVRSSSGGSAMVAAVFQPGSPDGIAIRPSTVEGSFRVGDTVQGPSGSMTITGRQGDDAYQAGVVLHAALRCSISHCEIRDTVYHALVIYNFCNQVVVENSRFIDPNRADTGYVGGKTHIFCDFDNANVQIRGNSFQGGLGYGIVVSETGGATANMTLQGNRFRDIASDAIRISSDSPDSFATIQNIRVEQNEIVDCHGVAVRCYHAGKGNGIKNAIIRDNRILGSDYGILLNGRVYSSTVTGNTLRKISKVALSNNPPDASNRLFDNH